MKKDGLRRGPLFLKFDCGPPPSVGRFHSFTGDSCALQNPPEVQAPSQPLVFVLLNSSQVLHGGASFFQKRKKKVNYLVYYFSVVL